MLSYLEVKKIVLYVISFYFYQIVNRVQVLLGTICAMCNCGEGHKMKIVPLCCDCRGNTPTE